MLSIGIIGLPNAGKSTLFNALLKFHKAQVAEHPFTTIDPNIGLVEVPDDSLLLIANSLSLKKQIPATIEFVDIAGLVKGAHKGEGLGNQFLAHIRECDAILHLVNLFDKVADPESDIETIKTELNLKDLEAVEKGLKKINKGEGEREKILHKIKNTLSQDKPVREAGLTQEEQAEIKDLNLLTQKLMLYVANASEENLLNSLPPSFPKNTLVISAITELGLIDLDEVEQKEYRETLGEIKSGLDKIIQIAYEKLDLITFYTLLPEQIQAWSIKKGTTAVEAAGKIHTDFAEKFIHAEICPSQKLIKYKSFQEAKEKGKVRIEGKNNLINDKDVVYFKHR